VAAPSPKVDVKKAISSYRARAGIVEIVDVPVLRYLMIDGHGDPNTSVEYADAVATLYPVAYTLKFASKQAGRDYVVPPLEALWWAEDMDAFTSRRDKSAWDWTVMLMVPDWIGPDLVDAAVSTVADRKAPRSIDALRCRSLAEGTCVQTLHIGPYDAEAGTLSAMHHDFIPAHGLRMTGRHHEIYLNDVRRVAPQQLRTILRQPVEKLG